MKAAGYLVIVGGVLLLLGGITGGTFMWELAGKAADALFDGETASQVGMVLQWIIFLATLGGLVVIIAGWLILKGVPVIPKILIYIGMGVGLLSLIIGAVVAQATGHYDTWLQAQLLNIIALVLVTVGKWLA